MLNSSTTTSMIVAVGHRSKVEYMHTHTGKFRELTLKLTLTV